MANLLDRLGDVGKSILSVKRGRWRSRSGVEPNDSEFQKIRPKILSRDDHTCDECNIHAQDGMEVHHRNDMHEDNQADNLKTVCPLCHATHHIGFLGKNGQVIHLEELSQADIFNLLRTAAVAMEKGDDEQKAAAQSVFDALDGCKHAVVSTWGSCATTDFADAMMSMPNEVYENRQMVMGGLRLNIIPKILSSKALPHIGTIQKEGGAYHGTPPSTWDAIYKKNLDELERRTRASSDMHIAEKNRAERLGE